MTTSIQVPGSCLIFLDGVELGHTRDGIEYTSEIFTSDVPGDQNGGDEGPPIDVQYLGLVYHLSLTFTRWEETIMRLIEARLKTSGAAGSSTNASIGELYGADSEVFRVSWTATKAAAYNRNFLNCIPRGQVTYSNIGTRWAEALVEFECHRLESTGVIWA